MSTSLLGRALQVLSAALALTGSLGAQAMTPPPYLQIFQEQIKVGRAGPHSTIESGWPRAFARAKTPNHYIAMTTIYGPPEAWFSGGAASIADIEQQNQAIEKAPGLNRELERLSQADAANLSGYRAILARYRPALSNAADVNPAAARVWEVLIFHVRPGREGSFAEASRLYRGMVEGARAKLPWATYEVMAGMPGPVFLVFAPHKTLAEIDPATGSGAAVEKAMNEETMQKFSALFEGFSSVENRIFAVSPEMSYPPPEWITQDSAFWAPKRSAASRPGTPSGPGQ